MSMPGIFFFFIIFSVNLKVLKVPPLLRPLTNNCCPTYYIAPNFENPVLAVFNTNFETYTTSYVKCFRNFGGYKL